MHHFLNILSIVRFRSIWPSSVSLAVVRHPVDMFHMELVRASARVFVHMLIFTIVHAIALAIACTIVRMIFLVGPGFEPLPVQHDYFVGPGFSSLALIFCFRPRIHRA